MREYTLFFEIFGLKKKFVVIARSEAAAKKELHDMIISKVTMAKIISDPVDQSQSPLDNFKDLGDLFEDFFKKGKFGK